MTITQAYKILAYILVHGMITEKEARVDLAKAYKWKAEKEALRMVRAQGAWK